MMNDDNVKEEEEVDQQQQPQQNDQPMDDTVNQSANQSNTASESGSAPLQEQQPPMQPRKAPNSWAAFLRTGKTQTVSPKRRSLRTVDHVSDKFATKGGGKGGKGIQSKNPDAMKRIITEAMKNKSVIWLSYNGHQKPFIPRAVKAIKWENNNNKTTFYAVQHRSKSQNQQRFFLKYVMQVRDAQWRIGDRELEQLKKRHQNSGWTENASRQSRQNRNRRDDAKRGGKSSYSNQQQSSSQNSSN